MKTRLDQLLFFALAEIYPHKTETELVNMLEWAKQRLTTDDSDLIEHEDLRHETEVS